MSLTCIFHALLRRVHNQKQKKHHHRPSPCLTRVMPGHFIQSRTWPPWYVVIAPNQLSRRRVVQLLLLRCDHHGSIRDGDTPLRNGNACIVTHARSYKNNNFLNVVFTGGGRLGLGLGQSVIICPRCTGLIRQKKNMERFTNLRVILAQGPC